MKKKRKKVRLLVISNLLFLSVVIIVGLIVYGKFIREDKADIEENESAVEVQENVTDEKNPDAEEYKEEADDSKTEQNKTKSADEEDKESSDKQKMIAIDAGHQLRGDNALEPIGPDSSLMKAKVTSGTAGVSTGIPEYELNLNIALKLKDELLNRGYQVYMVRETNDVRISNMERALNVNESGADIYIRIHADGSEISSTRGASALYPTPDNPFVGNLSSASKRLSRLIINAYCDKTNLNNRGLSPRDDLTGTNWSKIPVTLIELGFMSNAEEDRLMQQEEFQKKMVSGLADGIDAYFEADTVE